MLALQSLTPLGCPQYCLYNRDHTFCFCSIIFIYWNGSIFERESKACLHMCVCVHMHVCLGIWYWQVISRLLLVLQGFLHESPDGGEMSSLGTVSNPASDVSWEQVDERDSKITLWVPDHVVTHCASCDCPFWLGRRKHHCRHVLSENIFTLTSCNS